MKSVMCQVHEPITGGSKITFHNSISKAKQYCKNYNLKFSCIERMEPLRITYRDIENLAKQIKTYLSKKDIASDVCIYYNNCRECSDFNMATGKYVWHKEMNINPHDYFAYAAYDHILSMSFEGPFYDVINGIDYTSKLTGFQKILDNFGLYYELGNYWNLTVFPKRRTTKIDYTRYGKEKEPTYLYMHNISNIAAPLSNIMRKWYNMSKEYGEGGTCVLGAGFSFTYNDEKFMMCACSPYQGSLSWESGIEPVRKMLEEAGATEICYNWGVMD